MDVDLKQLGMQALQNRRYTEAVAQLSMHLQAIPSDYEAGTALALAYLKVGQPEESLRRFADLSDQYPFSGSVHFHHGLALAELGKTEDAIAAFERVLKLKPKHTGAAARLAVLRQQPKVPPVQVKKTAAEPPKFAPAPKTDPAPPIPLGLDEIEVLPDLDEVGLEEITTVPPPLPPMPARPQAKPVRPAQPPAPEPVLMAIPIEEPVAMAVLIEEPKEDDIVQGILIANSLPPSKPKRKP